MMKKKEIFVGGVGQLPEADIHKYFSQFGKIVSVSLVKDRKSQKSRGFGFVVFEEEDAAKKALKQQIHTLEDLTIECKPSQESKSGKASKVVAEPDAAHEIWIGGLEKDIVAGDLEQTFEAFGEVLSSRIVLDKESGLSRGFGFVAFTTRAAMDKALALSHTVAGKEVTVRGAEAGPDKRKNGRVDTSARNTVFVGGLAPDTTEAKFRETMQACGGILKVEVKVDAKTGNCRGFGFVTFKKTKGVNAALEAAAAKSLKIGQAVLSARIARSKKSKLSHYGGRGNAFASEEDRAKDAEGEKEHSSAKRTKTAA